MKAASLTVFIFCLGLVLAGPSFRRDFEEFKALHGKKYQNAEEEAHRFSAFSNNLRLIRQHNKEYDQGKQTYTLGLNKYSDMTPQEIRSTMNGYKERPIATNTRRLFQYSQNDNISKSIDWREKGAVTEVKDQGNCGSGWAFSATGSLEGQHFLKNGSLVSLSEQNLVDCSGRYGNNGCFGGEMDNGFAYIEDNGGIDTEESYPYVAKSQRCQFKDSNIGATDTGFVDLPSGDEDALKNAVATVGPISVAIDASAYAFLSYASGIYCNDCCSQLFLDHGVLVVGYGTSDNGTDYWLVKNSWGPTWGEDGYFKMCRNHGNKCGIATQASYPLV